MNAPLAVVIIIVSALVVAGVVLVASIMKAPGGAEDDLGFHYSEK